MGLIASDRWKPETLAQVRADLQALGPDAYRPATWLEEKLGRMRAERLRYWLREQAVHETQTPPEAGHPRPPAPSDDDLVISRWDRAGPTPPSESRPGFARVPIPEDATAEEPIEDVIARSVAQFAREKARAATLGPRQIQMPPGPYAIAHLGDPHLDDPGCDWPELLRTVRTIAATAGMYGANGGDTNNNWSKSGRLAGLWAEQGTTESDAWRIGRWLLGAAPWVYWMLGNHCLWNDASRMYRQLAEVTNAKIGVLAPDDIRLELVSPSGPTVRIHARHDFAGHSMYNDAHGLKRAALFGDWPADIYAGFHRHVAVAHQEESGGRLRTFLRARGFKRFDDYARSKGFVEQEHGAVITTVIDPACTHPADRVRMCWDIEEAAEMLTWLRRRRAA